MINTIKINKHNIFRLEYFLALYLVYCNGSWLMFDFKTILLAGLIILLTTYIIIVNTLFKQVAIPNFLIFFLTLFPVISGVINLNTNVNFGSILFTSSTYILLGFLPIKRLESIIDKYAQVIYLLAFVSIILGLIFIINYDLIVYLPKSRNNNSFSNSSIYYNLFIYTDREINDFRTQSIFWEPGAWAINQIFAFYWFIFEKKEYNKIPVFIASLFLTFSTTGFLLFFILIVAAFFILKERVIKRKIRNIIIGTGCILISVSVYVNMNSEIDIGNFLKSQIVGKFSGSGDDINANFSFNERQETTQKALASASENPFFGVGKKGDKDSLYVTSGIAEIAYQLGFIYLIIYLFIFRISFNKLGFITSCLFIIILLNGEAYSFYALFSLLLIYGSKQCNFKLFNSLTSVKQEVFLK